jgi:hypothetical protein
MGVFTLAEKKSPLITSIEPVKLPRKFKIEKTFCSELSRLSF